MSAARCPKCEWESPVPAVAGTTLFCEECGEEFQAVHETETYAPTLDIQRLDAAQTEGAPPPPQAPPATLPSITFPTPLRTGARVPVTLPPFPLELSLTFNYVLLAGANATCACTLRNTSAQTVSRIQLTLDSDAFKGGALLIDHDPMPPGSEFTDAIDLGLLDPKFHGPVVLKCTLRAGTMEGIRYAEGKLPGVVILPATASSRDIRLHIGDNFAMGAEGVNFNFGSQEDERELLQRCFEDAPSRPVALRPRGGVEAAALPGHFTNSLGMEFMRVAAGTRGVWFCQHLTTQIQWHEVTGVSQEQQLAKKGSPPCGLHPMMPVYGVNLAEAQDFCRRLGQMEAEDGTLPPGYRYRLPTESEWRAACGSAEMTDRELNRHAWTRLAKVQGPQIVGSLKASETGLYDLRGNVFEWCDPENPTLGKAPVFGGSWYADKQDIDLQAARQGSRIHCPVETRSSRIGFRIVLAPRF